MEDYLNVKVTSPREVIWEGKAKAVSSTNSQGDFDILPEHANFITLIEQQPIVIDTGDDEKRFSFHRAVIHTEENTVMIYAQLGKKEAE